jgi:ABC-type nitrate/sulfonate/bicarbonate transport system substrate-binding protein
MKVMRILAAAIMPVMLAIGPAAAAEKVKWGHINATAFYWDVYVAVNQGFMGKQNLEIEALRIDSASQSVQMVVTGAVDILSSNTELALKAIDKGGDLVIIANETARVPWSLMARPEIKKISDLKGKIVGVTQLTDASTTMTRLLLQKGGLAPGDYDVIQVGGTPTRYAALVRGAVQATVLAQPADLKAQDGGMNRLGGVQDAFEGPAIVLVARRSWAKENQDIVVRFLRGAVAGMQWLADPKNRAAAISILAERIGVSKEHAAATYDLYMKEKVISTDGELPDQHIKNYLALSASPVPADMSKYVDFSYLSRAKSKQ